MGSLGRGRGAHDITWPDPSAQVARCGIIGLSSARGDSVIDDRYGVPPATKAMARREAFRRAFGSANGPERWFLLAVVSSQVYYAYRYLLRYNDTTTSPTYTETPQSIQLGKYILFALLSLAIAASAIRSERELGETGKTQGFTAALSILFAGLMGITLLDALRSTSGITDLPKDYFFLPVVILMPAFYQGATSLERLLRVGMGLLAYQTIFDIYEFFEYSDKGRLPALAYTNGFVRFGAGLDDPNGFGILLVLFALIVLAGWPPGAAQWKRWITFAVIIYLLYKTLSYTSAVGFIVGVAAFVMLSKQFGKAVFATLVAAVGSYIIINSAEFQKIENYKAASAGSRFDFERVSATGSTVKSFFTGIGWTNLAVGDPATAPHSETAYLSIAVKFGVPITILLIALVLVTIGHGANRTRALRLSGHQAHMRLFAALTAFEMAVAVTALGVPQFEVFPVNLTFWVVAMVLWLPLHLAPVVVETDLVEVHVAPKQRLQPNRSGRWI